MKRYTVLLLMLMGSIGMTLAKGLLNNTVYYGRVGVNIGGTAPINMPATIRGMNKFTIQPNLVLGLDVYKPLNGHWGLMAGLHMENKNMKVDARVKNYHMILTQGGDQLEGRFTGNVVTQVDENMLTLPVQMTCDCGKNVRIMLGPYISYVLSHQFSGYAYNGYLRQGDPTGTKVMLGNDDSSRGDYNFSSDMRHWQYGLSGGIDWNFSKRWGCYANVAWGLSGLFKSDFHTLDQTLYPIYGTIGLTYKLK